MEFFWQARTVSSYQPKWEVISPCKLCRYPTRAGRHQAVLELILGSRNGFYLEDKGWTLAIHARFAAENEFNEVIAQARDTLDTKMLAGRFRILEGHRFLEIAPLLASKKETVSYILLHNPLPNARVLYIGDDDKDEEAFPLIHTQHGVAIKVFQPSQTSRPTEADFFFRSPTETLDWLEGLV